MPRFEVASARKVELHRGRRALTAGLQEVLADGAPSFFSPPRRCPAAPRWSEDASSWLIYALAPDGEASLKDDAEWRSALTHAYMCRY